MYHNSPSSNNRASVSRFIAWYLTPFQHNQYFSYITAATVPIHTFLECLLSVLVPTFFQATGCFSTYLSLKQWSGMRQEYVDPITINIPNPWNGTGLAWDSTKNPFFSSQVHYQLNHWSLDPDHWPMSKNSLLLTKRTRYVNFSPRTVSKMLLIKSPLHDSKFGYARLG